MQHAALILQALTEAKANDLLLWASRYHLFVHWSANRAHPWDSLPKSEAACAILEIGKLRNSDGEASPAHPSSHMHPCMRAPAWLGTRLRPTVLGCILPVHSSHSSIHGPQHDPEAGHGSMRTS